MSLKLTGDDYVRYYIGAIDTKLNPVLNAGRSTEFYVWRENSNKGIRIATYLPNVNMKVSGLEVAKTNIQKMRDSSDVPLMILSGVPQQVTSDHNRMKLEGNLTGSYRPLTSEEHQSILGSATGLRLAA